MKNKNKGTKENIHPTNNNYFPPRKNQLNLHKVGTVPFLNRTITNNSPDPRRSTLSNFQYCSKGIPRQSYCQVRYQTETLPLDLMRKKKKKEKKEKTLEFGKEGQWDRKQSSKYLSGKNRSSSLGKRSLSLFKTNGDQGDVSKVRAQLRQEVKKMSCKKTIKRKQFLKITNNYQSLLDKMSSLKTKPSGVEDKDKTEEGPGVGRGKLMLRLEDLKGSNIPDYDDQFMSHYQELSESWKRDIQKQKRF